ncbi:MAG TPA: restriction endonuclease subunit S, partial [Candidatus Kapabacteria bacterium]|nr:restriction endonuclease subunit S [Candidatus Kapabacteria bacterium]
VEKFLKGGKYEIEQLGKFIVDLKVGCSLPPDKRGVPEVPYILGKNLRHGYLDLSELEYISNVNNEKFKSSIVHENDILFSVRGAYIGKVAVVEKEIAGANIINNIVKITLSNKLNPRFVSAFLNSEIEQQLIYRDVWGGAQPGFTNENIKSLKIPLPPLSVQDKIAEEVKSRMQKAEQLQKEAKELLENAKEEIEKLILGE